MEKYTNREEQLADELIRALIKAEKREVGRNIDDPVDEESLNELEQIYKTLLKECHNEFGVEFENNFSTAFFKMLGFYPKFCWVHTDEYETKLDFYFNLPDLEEDAFTIQVTYDKEVQEGETFIDLHDNKHWRKFGCIRSLEDQIRDEVLSDWELV